MNKPDPLWYMDAVFYEVYVRGFFDTTNDGNGDLQGLASKLDYIQDLGVDCLWLMPIYLLPRVNHPAIPCRKLRPPFPSYQHRPHCAGATSPARSNASFIR